MKAGAPAKEECSTAKAGTPLPDPSEAGQRLESPGAGPAACRPPAATVGAWHRTVRAVARHDKGGPAFAGPKRGRAVAREVEGGPGRPLASCGPGPHEAEPEAEPRLGPHELELWLGLHGPSGSDRLVQPRTPAEKEGE